jgi:cytochrome c oxidase subunit IV
MLPSNTLPPTHESYVHVVPFKVLFAVFAALIVLTVVTVSATQFDLGSWNLILAMAIATVKASLVVLFFMHLRYDSPFNALIFIAALVFVALFLSLTLLDTLQYQPDIRSWQQANPPR